MPQDEKQKRTYHVEIFTDEEITILFHDSVPLVSRIPGGRILLSTDGKREEAQRILINAFLGRPVIDPDWLVNGREFQDGMTLNE